MKYLAARSSWHSSVTRIHKAGCEKSIEGARSPHYRQCCLHAKRSPIATPNSAGVAACNGNSLLQAVWCSSLDSATQLIGAQGSGDG
jgi:hypothetical protein